MSRGHFIGIILCTRIRGLLQSRTADPLLFTFTLKRTLYICKEPMRTQGKVLHEVIEHHNGHGAWLQAMSPYRQHRVSDSRVLITLVLELTVLFQRPSPVDPTFYDRDLTSRRVE